MIVEIIHADVHDRETLAAFFRRLADDFEGNGDSGKNVTVFAFLEALSAWLGSADQLSKNLGRSVPAEPSWQFMAEMLAAATVYE